MFGVSDDDVVIVLNSKSTSMALLKRCCTLFEPGFGNGRIYLLLLLAALRGRGIVLIFLFL